MSRKYRDGDLPAIPAQPMALQDEMNERRADLAEMAVAIVSDCAYADEAGGAFTDLSDTLACLRHFADRAGIGWEEVVAHADRAYVGDAEDAPHLAHDVDRFPGA